ncbi:MAG TPA: dTMP kinase [Candidatus Cloacimonetes bacterium]|nr:dTMP kinase [Candidatus Cloacimonadota bacterium]
MDKKGFFITFEGIEGCGKSTQVTLLAEAISPFRKVLVTREPGGPPISEAIRTILLNKRFSEMNRVTEVFLYMASRAQHTIQWILPNLEKGNIVICDRYYDSTFAYQGAARDISAEKIRTINNVATTGLKPDVTYIIDVPVEIGLERLHNGTRAEDIDRLESEDIEFHRLVRKGYLHIAKEEPKRVVVIDGKKSIKEIHEDIMKDLKERFNLISGEQE